MDVGLDLELCSGSLFWALLGPTGADPIPFRDELGFFGAQCLMGQQGSFNCHVAVVLLITNVLSGATLPKSNVQPLNSMAIPTL